MLKEELNEAYYNMTVDTARTINPVEGKEDYDYLHGRIKGYVTVMELVQEQADEILAMTEKDFPGMLAYIDKRIREIMMPPENVVNSMEPEYYRGKNETLKIAGILFRMFAKQKLSPPKPT